MQRLQIYAKCRDIMEAIKMNRDVKDNLCDLLMLVSAKVSCKQVRRQIQAADMVKVCYKHYISEVEDYTLLLKGIKLLT